MIRVWIETLWFEHFWQVRRDYARHLALQNAHEDRERRRNRQPPCRTRSSWSLLRELSCPQRLTKRLKFRWIECGGRGGG